MWKFPTQLLYGRMVLSLATSLVLFHVRACYLLGMVVQSYIICKVYIIHGAIQCTVTGPRKYVYDNTFGVKKVQPSKVESYLEVNA